jgi:hypothetical protein
MGTEDTQAYRTVRAAITGARGASIAVAVLTLGLGALIALGQDADATTATLVIAWSFGALFGAVGVLLFWVALVKLSPSRSPLLVALRERPSDLVWLYTQDVVVRAGGATLPPRNCVVYAKLADGSTVGVSVKKAKEQEMVGALRELAPAAVVGYTPEREARFKRDPRSVGAG